MDRQAGEAEQPEQAGEVEQPEQAGEAGEAEWNYENKKL